jgi:uncharacterized protein with HEPN domain
MPRDPRLYLDDILDAIGNIQEYMKDLDYETFQRDRKTRDAVIRNLEIIGEAAGRLPDSLRAAAADIEWRKIVALRNILTHEYFGVSLSVIWDVVKDKLGPLDIACRKLLGDEGLDRK